MVGRSHTEEERLQRSRELGIIVDPEDEWLLTACTWRMQTEYVATTVRVAGYNKDMFLHHCIMGEPILTNTVIDHRDRDPLNNRRSNLRYATKSQNYINSERSDNAIDTRRRIRAVC